MTDRASDTPGPTGSAATPGAGVSGTTIDDGTTASGTPSAAPTAPMHEVNTPAAPLPDNDPQVIGARAPAPDASAWERAPLTTPQERFDAAEKKRKESAPQSE